MKELRTFQNHLYIHEFIVLYFIMAVYKLRRPLDTENVTSAVLEHFESNGILWHSIEKNTDR